MYSPLQNERERALMSREEAAELMDKRNASRAEAIDRREKETEARGRDGKNYRIQTTYDYKFRIWHK